MHIYTVVSDEQALAAATAETLLQAVTGATRRLKISGFSLSGASVTSSEAPMLIEFLLQTTAGTASAQTPEPLDRADPAAIFTAQKNFTAEPTAGAVLRRLKMTPVGGTIIYHFPERMEIVMPVSSRVGFRVTSPSAQSGVVGELFAEE